MAIREKVTLVDDYSAKASKIAKSTSAMADAMSKSRSVAGAMASALKTAFNRNYTVKIKEIGSSKVRKEVTDLQKNLNNISKGAYNVNVTAKGSRMEKLKSNLTDIKGAVSGLKNKTLKFAANVGSLVLAKKKAMDIGRELTKLTGKRHRVSIELEKSGGGILSGFKDKMKSAFSKLNPMNWFKGKGGGGGMAGGEMEGFSVKKLILGNLLTKGIEGAMGGAKALISTSLGAGMERLSNIQSAKARLKGFGYDKEQVNQITTSATNAVTGTQYSMGDAMTASAGAIAAGIKPGELEGYLKDVGNAAAATGADFNDVASIMNKVKTTGHLQADEMRQLSDRGLPVLSKLAEQAGMSTEEMSKKISQGEVTFDQFRKAVSGASGSTAKEMANTKEGAFMNFKSALSKLGAGLLGGNDGDEGGVFSLITPALLKANDVLNSLVPKFKDAGDAIKNFVVDGFNKAKAGFSKVSELLKPGIEKVKEKFTTVFAKLGEAFAPLKDAFSSMFSGGLDQGMGLFSTLIDVVANALSFLADVIITASPIIQSIVSFISANVIPVIGNIVGWISGTLIPAIAGVASNVMGVLVPIIQTVASFISVYIMPILQVLGSIITGTVVVAFNLVAGVVETVIGVFNNLVGAVGEAINAFFSIPGKIARAIGNIGGSILSTVGGWFGGGGGGSRGHATGTEYFTGGFTRINERGEEMIQLARGDKIYPADKTSRIIKNEVQNTRTVDRSVAKPTINITVNGANMTNKDVAMVISNEIRRLGVLV